MCETERSTQDRLQDNEITAEVFLLEPALVLPDEPVTPQDQHAQLR